MPVPQRITVVNLGARGVFLRSEPSLGRWGGRRNDGSDKTYTSFTMDSLRLALHSIDLLAKEPGPEMTWSRPTRGTK
jgi:hypothetical protein